LGSHVQLKLPPVVLRYVLLVGRMQSPALNDFEVTTESGDFVPKFGEPFKERICSIEALESSPLDLQRSIEGVLHRCRKLGRGVGALDNPSDVDLRKGSAWKVLLHCEWTQKSISTVKIRNHSISARNVVLERPKSEASFCLTWVCLHAVTRSLALCGGGLVLLIGWACRQLETCSSSDFSNLLVGLKQALVRYPGASTNVNLSKVRQSDAPRCG
jgi:hypothetical protein